MVFQNYALYPHMTVRQNMAFSLKLAKAPQATIDERVGRAASILGLETLLDRYPRQLSGGQRQRVAMGRAIVRDPQVFLFDEPLSNLDAKLRVQMRTEIKELHQRLKTTAIYVTHDQIEAMTMADRIVVMQHGVVEQMGAPLELYDRPANLFVAGFIGSPAMNFIDAKVAPQRRAAGRRSPATAPSCRCRHGAPLHGRSRDRLRHPARASAAARGGRGLPAEVVVVEPTGAETLVVTRLAGHRMQGGLPRTSPPRSPASASASSRSSIRSICSTGLPVGDCCNSVTSRRDQNCEFSHISLGHVALACRGRSLAGGELKTAWRQQ